MGGEPTFLINVSDAIKLFCDKAFRMTRRLALLRTELLAHCPNMGT